MKTKVLVIDNYDSFVYNLVHYLGFRCEVTVYRNDEFNIDEIAEFDKILLSPGPGVPEEAGLLSFGNTVLQKHSWRLPWTASNWRSLWRNTI
jgi:anthranilate synthase component 2